MDTVYPPIADYALLSDCESTALVARDGSIDWCCMPTMDADPCFGRLLDRGLGGHCRLAVDDAHDVQREYDDGTLVLSTRFTAPRGALRLHDFFAMAGAPGRPAGPHRLARLAHCTAGEVGVAIEIAPRFDFGAIVPDLRRVGERRFSACGSNMALLIDCDAPLQIDAERAAIAGHVRLRAGERLGLSIRFVRPESLGATADDDAGCAGLEHRLDDTLAWWARWEADAAPALRADAQTRRSALVLKALCFERTGAIAAAATTSLPESPGGTRNWDYRFSWVRDSVLAVRALHALGFVREAVRFRDFIERSAAGSAEQLQIMVGLDGRRRLPEVTLGHLEGWRGARPVRVGNAAAAQRQLDVYGHLLELAWLGHDAAHPLDTHYWDFLVSAVDCACEHWREPDHGIWELRDAPRHFVHSKLMCWLAVDRAIALAGELGLAAPLPRWHAERQAMHDALWHHGYDKQRGVFVQSWGEVRADAALLRLPAAGFVAWDHPSMVRTADWIAHTLDRGGLLLRYDSPDGLPEPEGAFLPCTFWLAECLARQGRHAEALARYRRAAACANDLGLFSEEMAHDGSGMLGNFPQVLTHVSQIGARLALGEHEPGLA